MPTLALGQTRYRSAAEGSSRLNSGSPLRVWGTPIMEDRAVSCDQLRVAWGLAKNHPNRTRRIEEPVQMCGLRLPVVGTDSFTLKKKSTPPRAGPHKRMREFLAPTLRRGWAAAERKTSSSLSRSISSAFPGVLLSNTRTQFLPSSKLARARVSQTLGQSLEVALHVALPRVLRALRQ